MTETLAIESESQSESKVGLGADASRPVRDRSGWRQWAMRLLVFVAPTGALLAIGAQLSWLDNGIDPYIYVGVTNRLADYLDRWPNTYYPYRFGYLFPEMLAETIAGTGGGYLLLRFWLLGGVALTVWPVGRRRAAFGFVPAVVGGCLFALSPVVIRALFSTYTAATATLFFVLGVAVLIPARTRLVSPWRFALAGALFALSWNSHLTALPLCLAVIGIVALDVLIERRLPGVRRLIGAGLAAVAGTMATVGAAWLYYGIRFGTWGIYEPALKQSSAGSNIAFLEKTATWFTWRHYLLLMPVSLVVALVAHLGSSDEHVRRAVRQLALATIASGGVFAAFQWLRDDPLLSIYYYSCVPLALGVFLLARSAAVLLATASGRRRMLGGVAVLAAFVLGARIGLDWKPSYTILVIALLVVLVAGVVLVVIGGAPRARRGLVVLVGLTFASGLLTTTSPHDFPNSSDLFRVDPRYDGALFSYDQSALNIRELAEQYADFVPGAPDEPGALRVWFRPFGDSGRPEFGSSGSAKPLQNQIQTQVQSTLMHHFSALQLFPEGGLPNLTQHELLLIEFEKLEYVVLVDSDPAVVQQGVDALLDAGVPFDVLRSTTLSEGAYSVTVTVLKRQGA